MRYQWWTICWCTFVFVVYCKGVSSQVRVTRSADESLRIHNSYIVHFKKNVTELKQQHFVATLVRRTKTVGNFFAKDIHQFFAIKCMIMRLSKMALKWVTHHKYILAVKENEYIIVGSGNDSSSHTQAGWHLDRLDQSSLPLDNKPFAVNFSGSDVDAYVLDSGINYEHVVFNGRAHYPGCDPVDVANNENRTGRDCEGHGTHVAGLIGGKGTGVASNVTLFSVRILDCSLTASEATLIEGLMCVINHRKSRNGTRAIISLAIAGTQTSLGINKALQLALDNDIIIVASSGNGGPQFRPINYDSCKVYPAGYPGVVNVGATDIDDNALMGEFDGRIYTTNMGSCLDVFAPGYNILSSDLCSSMTPYDNRLCRSFRSGTPQSSAIVTGAVALLLEKCPKLTHIEVKNILRHLLSIKKVVFCKAFKYLTERPPLFDVISTVSSTKRRLLYLNLLIVDWDCTLFQGLPLF